MPILACGKTMRENPRQVLRRDSDAVVFHRNSDPVRVLAPHLHLDVSIGLAAVLAGVLCVVENVDEDLEDLVPVDDNGRHGIEMPGDLDRVAQVSCGVHFESAIHEIGGRHAFQDAGHFGVALLHGDDFFDMFDVARQFLQFLDQLFLLLAEVLRQLLKVVRQFASSLVRREEMRQVMSMILEKLGGAGQVGDLELAQPVGQDACGDIDAVEDIADVVKDV